jgi:hypothetical protein
MQVDQAAILERMPYLEAVSPTLPAEVRLNDVPLYRFDGAAAYRIFAPAFALLLHGRNELELRFLTPAPPGPAVGALVARLALFRDGEQAFSGGETLSALQLDGARLTIAETFVSPVGLSSLPWMALPPPTQVARTELPAFLRRLQAALDGADPAPIVEVSRPRIEHASQAFIRTREEVRAGLAETVAELGARTEPESPEPLLRLASAGAGRLVEPLGADGRPWLRRPSADGTMFFYPVMLGQVSASWNIFL